MPRSQIVTFLKPSLNTNELLKRVLMPFNVVKFCYLHYLSFLVTFVLLLKCK